MKNLMLIVSMLFLLSCGSEAPKNKKDIEADTEKAKTEKAEETPKNECEQFLDDYEAWVVEVETAYKKAKTDPSDSENTQKVLRAGEKTSDWANKWDSLSDCSDNDDYEDRFLDLEDRVNKCTTM
jgi:hypothetical protein